MTARAYTTPSDTDTPLRVVVFERAADGSPGFRTFIGRKVSVGPETVLFAHVDDPLATELVEAEDVLDETPLAEGES